MTRWLPLLIAVSSGCVCVTPGTDVEYGCTDTADCQSGRECVAGRCVPPDGGGVGGGSAGGGGGNPGVGGGTGGSGGGDACAATCDGRQCGSVAGCSCDCFAGDTCDSNDRCVPDVDFCTVNASGARWCWDNPLPQGNDLHAVFASNDGVAWMVGQHNTVLRYDSRGWARVRIRDNGRTPPLDDYTAVHGSNGADVWAVGSRGTLIHYDGRQWSFHSSLPNARLRGIWAISPTDAIAVGSSNDSAAAWRWNGTSWGKAMLPVAANTTLFAVTSRADTYYAVGGGTAAIAMKLENNAWSQVNIQSIAGIFSSIISAPAGLYAGTTNGELCQLVGEWQLTATLPAPLSRGGITSLGFDTTGELLLGSGSHRVIRLGLDGGFEQRADCTLQTSDCADSSLALGFARGAEQTVLSVGSDGRLLQHGASGQWRAVSQGASSQLTSVWGSGLDEALAVGTQKAAPNVLVRRTAANGWKVVDAGLETILAVSGSGPGDYALLGLREFSLSSDGLTRRECDGGCGRLAAAARGGRNLEYFVGGARGLALVPSDGGAATFDPNFTDTVADLVFASGNGAVVSERGNFYRYKPGMLAPITMPAPSTVDRRWAVIGDQTVSVVVGQGAWLVTGSDVRQLLDAGIDTNDVAGDPSGEFFIVGPNGMALSCKGDTCTPEDVGTDRALVSITEAGDAGFFAAGSSGAVLRRVR